MQEKAMTTEAKATRGSGGKFVKKDARVKTAGLAGVSDPAVTTQNPDPGNIVAGTPGDTGFSGLAAQAAEPGFKQGGFVWAMAHVRRGKTVKRCSWVGAKSVSADHAAGRVILENADIVADDWQIV
jgi:hypothetical protein